MTDRPDAHVVLAGELDAQLTVFLLHSPFRHADRRAVHLQVDINGPFRASHRMFRVKTTAARAMLAPTLLIVVVVRGRGREAGGTTVGVYELSDLFDGLLSKFETFVTRPLVLHEPLGCVRGT